MMILWKSYRHRSMRLLIRQLMELPYPLSGKAPISLPPEIQRYPEGVSAVGGKTGTTTAARSCLVQLFTDAQGQRYVAIILGCKERAILYEEMLSFLSNLNN